MPTARIVLKLSCNVYAYLLFLDSVVELTCMCFAGVSICNVLHMICTRLRLGHLSERIETVRCAVRLSKILKCAFECGYYYN